MMSVSKNMVVYFRYIMKNNKGDVIENITNGNSKCYLHGSLGILPSLQSQFEGLQAGDTKLVYLTEDSGLTGENFTFEVIIDEVRKAQEEELILGYPVIADNSICNSNCVCYDLK